MRFASALRYLYLSSVNSFALPWFLDPVGFCIYAILSPAWPLFLQDFPEQSKQCRHGFTMSDHAGLLHYAKPVSIGSPVGYTNVRSIASDLMPCLRQNIGLRAVHFVFPPNQPRRGIPVAQFGDDLRCGY